jgi:polyribonucleotide nucleotidyltransferase
VVPTEKDTLTSRLIDRPIRPLFADGWRCDTQVIITVLSHDMENDPDIVAMVAASAALTLSGAPFMGPIGGARVGFSPENEYVLNPTLDEMKESKLDLVVAGTQDAVLMVESEAAELTEEIMLGAVMFGHRHFQPVINAIISLAEKAAKEPREFALPDTAAIEKEMLGIVEADLRKAYSIPRKAERQDAVAAIKKKAMEHFFPGGTDNPERPMQLVAGVFKDLEAKIVRWNILDTSKRIDGRDLVTVRPIVCEAPFLPRTHGSALFTRGETQAIVVATLGTSEDEQFIDALQGTYKERSCCTTTSRRSRSVRPDASARPAAARSATANWRGVQSARSCRRRTSSPTPSAWCRRSPSPTARHRWRPCAAPRSR